MILRFVLQTAALHAPLQDWPPVGACSELQARVKKFHKRSGGKADFVPFVFADLRKCVARFACVLHRCAVASLFLQVCARVHAGAPACLHRRRQGLSCCAVLASVAPLCVAVMCSLCSLCAGERDKGQARRQTPRALGLDGRLGPAGFFFASCFSVRYDCVFLLAGTRWLR